MRIVLVLALLAAFAQASVHTPAVAPFAKERAQRYSDRVILAKPKAHHRATVDASEEADRVRVRDRFSRLGDLRVVELEAGESVEQGISRLQATGRYEFVEPDYIEKPDATPNDASFLTQWSLNNTGQLAGSTPGADIKAVPAWDIIREAPNVIVAVVDNGINVNHRDIGANLWRNPSPTFGDINGASFLRGVRSGNIADQTGHGTHVAGIIGAAGNNTFNISGIAWKVQLMALKNSDATGSSLTSDSAACIDYAISKGAHIINCSFGGSSRSQTLLTALRAARDAGVIVVASAGNDSGDNDSGGHFPSNYLLDNIVSVGNSGPSDLPSGSSAFGGLVDLYAPGTSILSLDLTTTGQVSRSGTSMAAPHVTGALALLRAQFPNDTYRQLINRLLRGVDRMSAFNGRAHSGGRLNLLQALNGGNNRPFNDDFAARPVLVGSGTTLRSNNIGATAEPGEPVHGGVSGTTSLWWQWTAPSTGAATFFTAGSSYDTVVAVYTGNSLGSLTPIASNDDANGLTTSQVSFVAQRGVTYQIAVTGKAGVSGLTVLNVGTAPANDTFAGATVLESVPSLQATGTTLHATLQDGEPRIGTVAGGGSVWFKWTAPRAGQFQVASFSLEFDTVLGVYTGTSVDRLTLVASNDDTGVDGANEDSLCTIQATAGTSYYFKVDCKDPLVRGEFTLTVLDSQWQFSTTGSMSGSPAIAPDGTIYIGGGTPDLNLYAVRRDGTLKWKYAAPGTLNSASPAVGRDGTIFFGTSDGSVTALKPDGTLLWQRALGAGSVSVSPALGIDGTVYLHGTDGFLYALDPATGITLWRTSVLTTSFASAAIGNDGTIYQPSNLGYLYALRPDGTLKWRFTHAGDSYSTPAIDSAGNIYFTTYTTATLFCVSPEGTVRWSYSAPLAYLASSPTLSADESGVYFGASDNHVYAINTVDGSLRWRTKIDGMVLASSAAVDADGTIYIGAYDNRLYALHPTGAIKRRWDTAMPLFSSPAIAGRALYVSSSDAKLYALDIDAGPSTGIWAQYRQNAERRGRVAGGPFAIVQQPRDTSTVITQPALLAVAASGPEPIAFQWRRNGVAIPGATLSTYYIRAAAPEDAGAYTVTVTGAQGSLTSSAATVTTLPLDPPRIANFSVHSVPGAGSQALIVGFTVGGANAKPVLIRGVGPALSTFGVGNAMADPQLVVTSGTTTVATNDNWGGDTAIAAATARVSAFPLAAASRDAALFRPLAPGRYSAEVLSANAPGGSALLELYEADPPDTPASSLGRLTNLSARGQVGGSAQATLTAGFTVVGNVNRNLLIRAIGPTLTTFGISGALADPVLEIYRGNTLLARNDEWGGTTALLTAFAQAGAFAIPTTSSNSALVISLPAGVYTARVTGFLGASGVALVEIYELP